MPQIIPHLWSAIIISLVILLITTIIIIYFFLALLLPQRPSWTINLNKPYWIWKW